MRFRHALLGMLLALPIGLLLSNGCGILASPVEGPKIAAVNSKLIAFTVDVVDESGVPVDGVKAHVVRHTLASTIFYPEVEDEHEADRVFDKKFTYSEFGQYAIVVRYSKAGYIDCTRVYSLEDHVTIRHDEPAGGALDWRRITMTFPEDSYVNTFRQQHSKVVLKQSPPPRSP